MTRVPTLISSLVGWLATATHAWGGLWQWTDGVGNVHKARYRDQIPAEFRAGGAEIPESSGASTAQSLDTFVAPVSGGAGLIVSSAGSAGLWSASDLVDKNGHDQEWWRQQVNGAREQVVEDEERVRELRNLVAHTTIARVELKGRRKLRLANEKLEADRKVIAEELPKRARAAGAPRRWLDGK